MRQPVTPLALCLLLGCSPAVSGPVDTAPADTDTTTDTDPESDTDTDADTDSDTDTDTDPIDAVATCAVPSLDELFPGLLPQSPWGDWPDAPSCLVSRHDVIIILGCPSEDNGDASACQIDRADKAVRFAAAGYGDRFIVTGNAVANGYVEATMLRSLLLARGVASDRIWDEPEARHTDENLYYSGVIMTAQGWDTALVISEPEHLMYTAVCDANCCVEKGRLSAFDYPVGTETEKAGTYVLYPSAATVTDAECSHITFPSKAMCTQLDSRLACADDFQL